MHEERRQQVRFRTYRPVRVRALTSSHFIETLTKNLSMGGLRCVSSQIFPVASELNIELLCFPGEEPLTFRGRTTWFQMLSNSEGIDLGVSFVNTTEFNKRRLSVCLERLFEQPPSAHR